MIMKTYSGNKTKGRLPREPPVSHEQPKSRLIEKKRKDIVPHYDRVGPGP